MTVIAVLGATGRVGGATARALLERGVQVRAITRDPASEAARGLAELGAEVVRAEMTNASEVVEAIAGVDGLFNVQSAFDDRGRYQYEAELEQGLAVAEAAGRARVPHVVYSGAGTGERTGLAHFDAKLEIAEAFRERSVPLTVVNPAPFMELMTDSGFVPVLSTWGAQPRVLRWDTPMPWIATRDVGRVAAAVFERRGEMVGRVLNIGTTTASLGEARELYREVAGRKPRRVPMPVWVFRRMVGGELPSMWSFMREHEGEMRVDFELARELAGEVVGMREFLAAALGVGEAEEVSLLGSCGE